MKLIEDTLEAFIDAVLEDEVTAVIVGIPLLTLCIPVYLLWAWWPRKRPLEFR